MENDLRLVVDTLPGLVWTALPTGQVDFLNQPWCDYAGMTLEEASGVGWLTAVCPDDLSKLVKDWESILESGVPGEIEARLRRSDGIFRWFLFRANPLRDASGNIVKWIGTNTDIEDRVVAEDSLRASEQHLQQLVDTLKTHIEDQKRAEFILAAEKRLLEMVATGESLTRVLTELCRVVEAETYAYCSIVLVDPMGAYLEGSVAPSLPKSFVDAIDGRPVNEDSGPCAMAAFLNQQVISADIATDTRWSEWEWCPLALQHGLRACWSTPIRSKLGKALGAFALYCDQPRTPTAFDQKVIDQFTHLASIAIDRARSDAALQRSEDLLAAVQHLSSTGAFSWRVATDEIAWSKEVYRLFEVDEAVPVTLELVASRVHPEDLVSFHEMIERQRSGSDFEYETRLLMRDGSIKYVHVVAHATKDRDGTVEYIAAVQNVTDRRLSEEALERARLELARVARISAASALTASIAHEVNQPLSGVITNGGTSLRMLTEDPPNVGAAIETMQRAIRDANRAAQVVARVRALYRKDEAASDWLDLNEAVREVVLLSANEIARARVTVVSELSNDLPLVRGDRVQLQQVVLNLLLNGIEAMGPVVGRPRQLVIQTESEEDDRIRLCVRDNGSGLDPNNLNQPFEAFYTTKGGGMGIGLSVSRSIIQNHDGRLWAMTNDGPGATFAFSIPRESDRGIASA
jgi:PAS domain S-box-containing protein